MIDGTYTFEMDTPLGRKSGTANLRTQGDTVYAEVDAPVIGKQSAEGSTDGISFTAQGSFKQLLLGKVDYTLSGEVVGDELRLAIKSNKGDFRVLGTRV